MEASKGCNCFIIPPYIQKKIEQAEQDPEIQRFLKEERTEERILRKERAKLFKKRKNLPHFFLGNVKIKIYTAEQDSNLPGRLLSKEEVEQNVKATEVFSHIRSFNRFFKDVFKRNSLDDQGGSYLATIHYREHYSNAFWNGRQIVFGDGDERFFNRFTKDIDIVAHELGHALTEYDNDLVYMGQSGALNESISDVFGSMLKQHAFLQTVEDADWLIGDRILKDFEEDTFALRSLSNPGEAYTDHPILGDDPQPRRMDAYVYGGGVHLNSGIPNHAFFRACTRLFDIDREKYAFSWNGAGKVWYNARVNIHAKDGFASFAKEAIKSAAALFGKESQEEKAVRYAWADVLVEPK